MRLPGIETGLTCLHTSASTCLLVGPTREQCPAEPSSRPSLAQERQGWWRGAAYTIVLGARGSQSSSARGQRQAGVGAVRSSP